jgi:hypothetical protein
VFQLIQLLVCCVSVSSVLCLVSSVLCLVSSVLCGFFVVVTTTLFQNGAAFCDLFLLFHIYLVL